jgi:hypothetical protein
MATNRRFTRDKLRWIFTRTDGCCHLCHRKLSYCNYGKFGTKGSWEVDHSKARARNGSDSLQNCYPAHISCNRSKQAGSSKTARAKAGYPRTPYTPSEKAGKRSEAGFVGAFAGAATALLANLTPAGILVSTLGGALAGRHIARNPRIKKTTRGR